MLAVETCLVFMYGTMEEISRYKYLIQDYEENMEELITLADIVRQRQLGKHTTQWALDYQADCL
ncbi:MAG: hypothetical protein U9P14_10675 [Gemmatimonadota bacterium]|nr:hypothetical protein [Gemmatimonadota bacterium]